MTDVIFCRDGAFWTMQATGHATGSPEVCAAVSTLVQTLETALDVIGADERQVDIEDGWAEITARGLGVTMVYECIRASFMRLAAGAPEYVTVQDVDPADLTEEAEAT